MRFKSISSMFNFFFFKVKSMFPTFQPICKKLVNYLKSLPPNADVESKELSVMFTTENIINCVFSLDAKCFEPDGSEFRQIGGQLYDHTIFSAFKWLVRPILPQFLVNLLPVM